MANLACQVTPLLDLAPPQEPSPHRFWQHVPGTHEHHLQPFPHPASHHHRVIAEAHDTAMPTHFYTFDIVDEYYRLSYLHTG
jgi:hypothetical protein